MSESIQQETSQAKATELVAAVGFIALAGVTAGTEVALIESEPFVAAAFGIYAAAVVIASVAIATNIWKRFHETDRQ